MSNLAIVFKVLKTSLTPEDVFGDVGKIEKSYRYYAKIVHPDLNQKDKATAEEAFKMLTVWHEKALSRVRMGLYGKKEKVSLITIASKTGNYSFETLLAAGDLSDVYAGEKHFAKIVRSPKNNDLILNEANILKKLNAVESKLKIHVPKIVDCVDINVASVNKKVNIFEANSGCFTLEKVIEKYPKGVTPNHAAWMWNRMMGALHLAHSNGFIHGALVPNNFLINPETHNGILIDWCYGCAKGGTIKAIVPKYKAYYPPEVFEKKALTATDIYMSAKCIIKVLGGNPETNYIPDSVPKEFAGFLRYCTFVSYTKRESDVIVLFNEFREVLERIFGKPKFHEFKM